MITNIHKNRMGTVSFDGKFLGMRKPQEFVVYPIKAGDDAKRLLVQSDTRIGYIYLDSGNVDMSKPHVNGAYGIHLHEITRVGKLTQEDLFHLKAYVFSTANGAAGKAENGFIQTDNSGALEVF